MTQTREAPQSAMIPQETSDWLGPVVPDPGSLAPGLLHTEGVPLSLFKILQMEPKVSHMPGATEPSPQPSMSCHITCIIIVAAVGFF